MKVTCKGTAMKLKLGWSYGDYDIEVAVEGCYYPGRPARISGPPEDCYPEDPDSFEIYELAVDDGLEHEELFDDDKFFDALMDAAREEYMNLCDERNAEQASDMEYWRDYDNGR